MGTGVPYATTFERGMVMAPAAGCWNTQLVPLIAVSFPLRRSPLASTSVSWAAAMGASATLAANSTRTGLRTAWQSEGQTDCVPRTRPLRKIMGAGSLGTGPVRRILPCFTT
jgi:hypothetical protein